jgi:hypothetical protein
MSSKPSTGVLPAPLGKVQVPRHVPTDRVAHPILPPLPVRHPEEDLLIRAPARQPHQGIVESRPMHEAPVEPDVAGGDDVVALVGQLPSAVVTGLGHLALWVVPAAGRIRNADGRRLGLRVPFHEPTHPLQAVVAIGAIIVGKSGRIFVGSGAVLVIGEGCVGCEVLRSFASGRFPHFRGAHTLVREAYFRIMRRSARIQLGTRRPFSWSSIRCSRSAAPHQGCSSFALACSINAVPLGRCEAKSISCPTHSVSIRASLSGVVAIFRFQRRAWVASCTIASAASSVDLPSSTRRSTI